MTGNSGFPKSMDVGKAFDKRAGAERKVIGVGNVTCKYLERGEPCRGHADSERSQSGLTYHTPITAPATELARKWDGWGTALKPSHEPIIVARKPLDGTVADNVERWGTGAINIDGCRIPTSRDIGKRPSRTVGGNTGQWKDWEGPVYIPSELGRFPANCVTTEPDAFYSPYFNVTPPELCKKASKRDRNSDWRGEEITLEPRNNMRVNAPRASEAEKHATTHRNNHPTVKPTDLMSWLVRLVTPPGGVVLDPFAGSGSTLVAARREGFGFIGIERELEYVEIARKRVGEIDTVPEGQLMLF